jgi:hypothetical protein
LPDRKRVMDSKPAYVQAGVIRPINVGRTPGQYKDEQQQRQCFSLCLSTILSACLSVLRGENNDVLFPLNERA